jgi:hypothetical protein
MVSVAESLDVRIAHHGRGDFCPIIMRIGSRVTERARLSTAAGIVAEKSALRSPLDGQAAIISSV